MINGFVKYYYDGSKYVGDFEDEKISWRNSSGKQIVSLLIVNPIMMFEIFGSNNDYWHSNIYEVSLGDNNSRLIKSIYQCQISPLDLFIGIRYPRYNKIDIMINKESSLIIPIVHKRGQWLTLDIDYTKRSYDYYYLDGKT
jgi:hypothetical protein